jgi:hypothetical protein
MGAADMTEMIGSFLLFFVECTEYIFQNFLRQLGAFMDIGPCFLRFMVE